MAGGISQILEWFDQHFAEATVDRWERKGSLVNLFFHGLFLDENEPERELVYPQQRITVQQFEEIIRHFLEREYRFVSPAELIGGLDSIGKYATLTFDDGYYNNSRALPILEKYRAHATIFVSARHVNPGKGFWWEALYRARRKEGKSMAEISPEMDRLNTRKSAAIEAELVREFGNDFLRSKGEADRPFTAQELKDLARSPHITIGNHTADHSVLTAYNSDEVFEIISQAQSILEETVRHKPLAIAYPNGAYTRATIEAAIRAGLKIGFSTEERKEYLPGCMEAERRMVLGRYRPFGGADIQKQAKRFRSDLMLGNRLRSLKHKAQM
jgi:peptidoglycan/xylan/chitin deacetylase (PgdA/CDA1 family)